MRQLIALALALALSTFVCAKQLQAADKYSIGLNEEWVSGYFQSMGQNCSDCPTNSVTATYDDANNIIYDLIKNQHVGMYREIVPVSLIVQDGNNANYANIIKILSIYSGYNLQLDLSMGLPLPPSMTVTGDDYKIMPHDNASWNTLKNSLSFTMGGLLNAMWNSPSISRQWMSQRLFVEGFSEFDALQDLSQSSNYSSPTRAVDLTWGINTVINQYNIVTQQTMPSSVGNYYGYNGQLSPGTDPIAAFVSDYYYLGGIGYPNVHLYATTNDANTTYQDIVAEVGKRATAVGSVVPSKFVHNIIVGETGNADISSGCAASTPGAGGPAIDPNQRIYEYAALAEDPTINNYAGQLMFWRLFNIPAFQTNAPDSNCQFGVLPYNGPTYNAVGTNLFSYLNSP